MREQKSFKTILPDEGKKLLINDALHDKIIVALNSRPQVREIEVPSYIGNATTLDEIKNVMILQTKLNLAQYLEDNPLFSKCKYPEGRYYKVTAEKQQQLTSTLASYEAKKANGIESLLSWNSVGLSCEDDWTSKQLWQLAFEIEGYVKPFVKLQQKTEEYIVNSETIEDVLKIDVNPYGNFRVEGMVTDEETTV